MISRIGREGDVPETSREMFFRKPSTYYADKVITAYVLGFLALRDQAAFHPDDLTIQTDWIFANYMDGPFFRNGLKASLHMGLTDANRISDPLSPHYRKQRLVAPGTMRGAVTSPVIKACNRDLLTLNEQERTPQVEEQIQRTMQIRHMIVLHSTKSALEPQSPEWLETHQGLAYELYLHARTQHERAKGTFERDSLEAAILMKSGILTVPRLRVE